MMACHRPQVDREKLGMDGVIVNVAHWSTDIDHWSLSNSHGDKVDGLRQGNGEFLE